MTNFFAILITLFAAQTFAVDDSFELTKNGKKYYCAAITDGDFGSKGYCAEMSIKKKNMVDVDCKKIKTFAQDKCAGESIKKAGYINDGCYRITFGAQCAAASIDRSGVVVVDCEKVKTDAQDVCAAAAIKKKGFVPQECLSL